MVAMRTSGRPLSVDTSQRVGNLDEDRTDVDPLKGKPIGQVSTEHLHQACDAAHDGDENADAEGSVGNETVLPLLKELRERHLRGVKDETGDEHRDQQNRKNALRARGPGVRGLVRGYDAVLDETFHSKKQECHAGECAHHPGYDERRAPARNIDERPGDDSGERAKRTKNTVDPQRLAPRNVRVPDEPRYADRMIDRGKQADAREPRHQKTR